MYYTVDITEVSIQRPMLKVLDTISIMILRMINKEAKLEVQNASVVLYESGTPKLQIPGDFDNLALIFFN